MSDPHLYAVPEEPDQHRASPGQGMNGSSPYYPPAPLIRPTSGLAVAGFVLSLLGLSLLAVVLCGVAVKSTSRGLVGGHGLAIAGLIIGGLGCLGWLVLLAPFALVVLAGITGA